MRSGTYHYHLIPAGAREMVADRPFTIETVESPKEHTMDQHTVLVNHESHAFRPDKPKLKIRVGDLIMWSCRQQSVPPFEVVGDQEFFGSASLVNECGYAHAFSAAGEYSWVDIFGSGLSGVIRVHDPKCQNKDDLAKWRQMLKKGTLVMIADGKAKPAEVEIVIGQTVYFAVVKTDGISITDRRLVNDSTKKS